MKKLSLATSIATIVLANSAFSQELMLEELVVTAQKRSQSVQEVPVAMAAFSARTLEQKGITTTDDLSVVTPGLQAGRQTSSSTPYMRGVGTQSAAAGDESSIAMYVDGVYQPNVRSNSMSFNNVERIEVLKGPQGTLFGRNATGGLIHVITKDPTFDPTGKIEISYGNYDTIGGKAYVSGGLSDTVAADFAVLYEDQRDGWGENLVTGSDVNLSKTEAYRSKILWNATDDTEVKLGLSYSESEGDIGIARQIAPGAFAGDFLLYALSGLPVETAAALAQIDTYTGDWYDVATENDVYSNSEDKAVTLHVKHSFENYDILSVTAWQDNSNEQLMDVEASSVRFQTATELGYDTETWSQEVQLTSTGEGAFQWILGFFYMESKAQYTPFELEVFGIPSAVYSTNAQDTTSASVFFQGDYQFTDATTLTLGARVTQDERELDADFTTLDFATFMPVSFVETADEEWVETTWRISLDHQVTDEFMVFSSYSRGFKSGVYNLAGSPADPVDPETLDAIEFGFKSDLLDSTLRLNGSFYFYDYEDVQLQRVESGAAFLVNAAGAEIYGMELDATWLVTEGLTLTSGLSLSDSEYTEYPDGTVNIPTGFGGNYQVVADLSGNEVIRTPELTFNFGVSQRWNLDAGALVASANYYYNDGFYWEPENRLEQDAYEIVNAELSWYSPNENWRTKLFAKNVFHRKLFRSETFRYQIFLVAQKFG